MYAVLTPDVRATMVATMAENRDSVAGVRILKPSERGSSGRCTTVPGEFAWEFDFTHFEHGAKQGDAVLTLYIHLPGNGRWSPIQVQRAGAGPHHDRIWEWDGDLDKPTLTPSIWDVGVWHGYMRAGFFQSI